MAPAPATNASSGPPLVLGAARGDRDASQVIPFLRRFTGLLGTGQREDKRFICQLVRESFATGKMLLFFSPLRRQFEYRAGIGRASDPQPCGAVEIAGAIESEPPHGLAAVTQSGE